MCVWLTESDKKYCRKAANNGNMDMFTFIKKIINSVHKQMCNYFNPQFYVADISCTSTGGKSVDSISIYRR
jgi:hypothetical protein